MGASHLINKLIELNVSVTFDGEKLKYCAPNGVMNQALVEAIREDKENLICLFKSELQKLKQKYNRFLQRFKEIESLVERSPNQDRAFLEHHDEWLKLSNQLTGILHKIGTYSKEEVAQGFPCQKGVGHEK